MAYTTIDKSDDYFNTVLYTGNGSTQSITGVGFAPDMVWTKKRSATDFHAINDKVRGALKILFPNTTDAEDTSSGCLTSFDSDGFSLGSNGGFNASSATFVSWNWLAGGTASSNTDGTITSSVSANTTSGFSIVSYTGTGANATVGHGLNSAPEMIILKNRIDAGINWITGCEYYSGWDYIIELNLTDAESNAGGAPTNFNSTAPTSSVFSVGTSNNSNGSADGIIAYCFHSVKGFSKIGKYTGNGSTDGTFVYTGFKPAFVLLKNTDAVEQWWIFDNKRNAYTGNFIYYALNPNGSSAENTTLGDNNHIDFLSNGFKLRTTAAQLNGSGNSFIYMAFAENPFVTSTGIPATAR